MAEEDWNGAPIHVCAVEVGTHPGPYWRDRTDGMIVCSRHKAQYDERPDLGPFDWEPALSYVAEDPRPACVVCADIHALPCEDACLSLQGDRAKGGTA